MVTGLNSTVSEIHDIPKKDKNYQRLIASKEYGHFGRVGEAQLWWFKARLDVAKEQGVFRLGVVHHNRHRDPVADDENLRDAALLEQHLGESLNLLLHGHTHNSKIDWVNPHLPVLSTGSAALTKDVRPDQVPNQYQVVRIRPDRLERWTRRFDPGSMRWEADTRCSEDGNSWHVVKKVPFLSVHLTFPKPPPPEMGSRHLLRSHVLRPPPYLACLVPIASSTRPAAWTLACEPVPNWPMNSSRSWSGSSRKPKTKSDAQNLTPRT